MIIIDILIVDSLLKKMYVFSKGEIVKCFDVIIGKEGVCEYYLKKEGDMKTPLGLYNLGVCFGKKSISNSYPFVLIDENTYFVDDVNSKYYNCFVQIDKKVETYGKSYIHFTDKKEFNSAEHMIDYDEYECGIFVEYNVNPTIKSKGSAIFIHIKGNSYTLGCIGVSKCDMEYLIDNISLKTKILII
ncbi:MAG: L,D-transpeptidase family protein [Bacilli bacterium]|nr:L,D-transpeptidase family protein [Bacilli bacterium]